MIQVSVPCGLVDVEAEVERLEADDFVLIWCEPAAVLSLGLSEQKLAALMVRCKLECLRIESLQLGMLETLREQDGIASLLDDVAPAHCSDRDSRISEVA